MTFLHILLCTISSSFWPVLFPWTRQLSDPSSCWFGAQPTTNHLQNIPESWYSLTRKELLTVENERCSNHNACRSQCYKTTAWEEYEVSVCRKCQKLLEWQAAGQCLLSVKPCIRFLLCLPPLPLCISIILHFSFLSSLVVSVSSHIPHQFLPDLSLLLWIEISRTLLLQGSQLLENLSGDWKLMEIPCQLSPLTNINTIVVTPYSWLQANSLS